MKLWIVISTILSILLAVFAPLPLQKTVLASPAAPLNCTTADFARQAANNFIELKVQAGDMPDWEQATAGVPFMLLGTDGTVKAYQLTVKTGELIHGYVVIQARNCVIASYTQGLPPQVALASSIEQLAQQWNLVWDRSTMIYTSPLDINFVLRPNQAPATLYVPDEQSTLPRNEFVLVNAMNLRSGVFDHNYDLLPSFSDGTQLSQVDWLGLLKLGKQLSTTVATEQIESKSQVTLASSTKTLQVPHAWFQFQNGACLVGCTPMAGTTLVGYWAQNNYPNVMNYGDWNSVSGTAIRLSQLAETWCCGTNNYYGCTWFSKLGSALTTIMHERGYPGFTSPQIAASFDAFAAEIDNSRPVVVNFDGDGSSFKNGHSNTGYGYNTNGGRFMLLHTNLSSVGDQQVNFDADWYGTLFFTTLVPPQSQPSTCSRFSSTSAPAALNDGVGCNGANSKPLTITDYIASPLDASWNDKTSSIYVQPGRSIMVFEHGPTTAGGGRKCLTQTADDLSTLKYDISGATMNKSVSYYMVFSNATCTWQINKAELKSPVNGAVVTSLTPTLSWSPVYSSGGGYDVQVSTSATFASNVMTFQTAADHIIGDYTIPAGKLLPGTLYYWRVSPKSNDLVNGAYSVVWSFKTSGTTQIVLNSPTSLTPAYTGDSCSDYWVQFTSALGAPAFGTLTSPDAANSSNSAEWRTTIPTAGKYRVEVFIPRHNHFQVCSQAGAVEDTLHATYWLSYNNTSSPYIVNQQNYSDEWVTLADVSYSAGELARVSLNDNTGEALYSRYVTFSGVRFTQLEEQPSTCYGLNITTGTGGTVSANTQPNCTGGKYLSGTNVTLTAIPATGYNFSSWGNALSGTKNPATLSMSADKTVSASFTLIPVPAPTGLSASDGTSTSLVKLTWNSVAEASKYQIYRNINGTMPSSPLAETAATSYDDTSALPGVTYTYWVKAANSTSTSVASAPDTGTRGSTAVTCPRMSLKPALTTITTGQTVVVLVEVDICSQLGDTVDIYLNYPTSVFELVTTSGAPATSVEINTSLLPVVVVNSIDPAAGQVSVSASNMTTTFTGKQTVATLRFKAKVPAQTAVMELVKSGSRISDVIRYGSSLRPTLENTSLTITGGVTLNGKVAIERLGSAGDSRWPIRLGRSCDATKDGIFVYRAGTTELIYSGSAMTDASGTFSVQMNSITPGSYDIVVKGETHLAVKRSNVSLPTQAQLDFGTLKTGDTNGDNRINGGDVSYMIVSYLLQTGQANFRRCADVNRDNNVNGADVSFLIPNYLQEGVVMAQSGVPGNLTSISLSSSSIRLVPQTSRLNVNQTIAVEVWAEITGQSADFIDLFLDFDPKVLQIVNASGQPVDSVGELATNVEVVYNKVDRVNGQVNLSAARFSQPYLSGSFHVATIYVKALTPASNTSVQFSSNGARSSNLLLSGFSLNPVLTPVSLQVVGKTSGYQMFLPLTVKK